MGVTDNLEMACHRLKQCHYRGDCPVRTKGGGEDEEDEEEEDKRRRKAIAT